MDNKRIVRRVDQWKSNEKKSRGQQKPRWKYAATEEVRLRVARGIQIEEQAIDRSLWKSYHQPNGHIADHDGTRVK